MNRYLKKTVCILLLCVSGISVFAGCGQRQFEKIEDIPTETETVVPDKSDPTEPQTDVPQGMFSFAKNIRMGMTLAEVQAASGQISEVSARDGRKSISNTFSGIFIKSATEKSVVFMFSAENDLLEQLQFRGNTVTDGMNTAEAVALFDSLYGKQALYQGRYRNHIWKTDNVYVLLSELDIDNYAVTYTEETYFEREYSEEAEAYRRAV